MSELTVTFLGTSAAIPTPKRNVASVAVQHDGKYLLFDCGEGTQRQMMRYTGLKRPAAIFLTHYHPDHWLGLPGLFATLDMQNQHEDNDLILYVYGPHDGIGQIQTVCQHAGGHPDFVKFVGLGEGDEVSWLDGLNVRPFPTEHTKNSQGYILEEPERPGRFDPTIATFMGLMPPQFKRVQNGETVNGVTPDAVMGPTRPGRKLVITGDTRPCEATVRAAYEADLLIHEATFSNVKAGRAVKTKHSTGFDAAHIARSAGVPRLVLTHFSPSSEIKEIGREASAVFSPSVCATDGHTEKIKLAN